MKNRLAKWMGFFFVVLLVNTAYVAAFSTPSIFYMTNVLAHLGRGLALAIGVVFLLLKDDALRNGILTPLGLFAVALALGLFLAKAGNITENRWAFWGHIGSAGLGLLALLPYIRRRARADGGGWMQFKSAYQVAVSLLILAPASTAIYQRQFPEAPKRVQNPLVVPTS